MERARAAIAPLLAVAACAACGPRDAPPATDTATSSRAVQQLRIGVAEGADEYLFGEVIDIAEGRDGSIFVADWQPLAVRRYSGAGAFLGRLGRHGQGPGEYAYVVALHVLPSGELAIHDSGNARITLYSQDGEHVGEIQTSGTGGDAGDLPYDHEGNLYLLEFVGGKEPFSYLQKLSPDGDRLERVPVPGPDYRQEGQTFVIRTPEDHLEMFPVVTLWAWSPHGYLVTGRNDRYAIEVRPPGPDVVLSRDLPAPRFRPEERAQLQAWIDYYGGRVGGDMRLVELPDEKPYYRRIDVDDEGHVWVQRYIETDERDVPLREPGDNPPLTWVHPITYDVFVPDGTFLGTVTLPQRTRALVLGTRRIWGVTTDEDGIEYIVRLHVTPPLTGSAPPAPRSTP